MYPRSDRGWSRKRSPRYCSSVNPARCRSTPMLPSSTARRVSRSARKRSAAVTGDQSRDDPDEFELAPSGFPLPGLPDLLRRPLLGPLGVRVVVGVVDRVQGRIQLDEIEDLEARAAEHAQQVAVGQVELRRRRFVALGGPVDAAQAKLG